MFGYNEIVFKEKEKAQAYRKEYVKDYGYNPIIFEKNNKFIIIKPINLVKIRGGRNEGF